MTRQKIRKLIQKASGQREEEIQVDYPPRENFGDYTTNIAFQLKKPAEEIVKKLSSPLFEKIEVKEPGFINFFLAKDYLQKKVAEILKKGEKFGELKLGKKKKIQVEFISANPTGPLTVGNARGGPFGDVLANVLEKAGFKVEKAYYINDYGKQILGLGYSLISSERKEFSEEKKYRGKYIEDLKKRIQSKDPYQAGQEAARIIIEEMIKKTTEKMGIKYDEWFWESYLHQSSQVDKTLEFLRKKGLIYEKEGAKFFQSSQFGDQRDRVVVKADGWKTYLAGDLAYHRYKFEKKKFDKVINIWGADHSGEAPGLLAGLEALGYRGKLDIVFLQFVIIIEKGEGRKMSKRKGIYVTMDELLERVGRDPTRLFFLEKSADAHLNFDLSLARERSEKNPVYYIQYAYARICSLWRKAGQPRTLNFKSKNLKLLNHPSELILIKQLIKFPEIIEDITKDYQVQRLPQYARSLAASFHQFYRDCRVISEDRKLTQARLALVLASQIVLKNTFDLMGISAPERM